MESKQLLKKTGDTSLKAIQTAGGFVGANALAKIVPGGIAGSLIIFIVGLGLALVSPMLDKNKAKENQGNYIFQKLLPDIGVGTLVYGTFHGINQLADSSAYTGVSGLGFIPVNPHISKFVAQWIPLVHHKRTAIPGAAAAPPSQMKGILNGAAIDLVKQADGSYAMAQGGISGLGNVPMELPNLLGVSDHLLGAAPNLNYAQSLV